MLQNIDIMQIMQATIAEVNFMQEKEDQILMGSIRDFAELINLFCKDAIGEETRILPDTAGAKEKAQYNEADCSNTFDKLLMLAAMLVEDKRPFTDVMTIGTGSYGGKNNPYDYSWFEGEVEESDRTILDYVHRWYAAYPENRTHFARYYKLAEGMRLTSDIVWEMCMAIYSA